jgi:DnaJ-class molecular chaperone
MPKKHIHSEAGELHAKVNIQFPKTLNEKQRALIDQILSD